MQIKRLYVKNFRNIREQEFCFHENVNVLCGNNAQGKTNLCEAISLCMGPSFRTSKQSSYIPFSLDNSKEKCVIKIWFTTSFNTQSENIIEFTIGNNNLSREEELIGLNHIDKTMYSEYLNYLLNKYLNIQKQSKNQNKKINEIISIIKNRVHN